MDRRRGDDRGGPVRNGAGRVVRLGLGRPGARMGADVAEPVLGQLRSAADRDRHRRVEVPPLRPGSGDPQDRSVRVACRLHHRRLRGDRGGRGHDRRRREQHRVVRGGGRRGGARVPAGPPRRAADRRPAGLRLPRDAVRALVRLLPAGEFDLCRRRRAAPHGPAGRRGHRGRPGRGLAPLKWGAPCRRFVAGRRRAPRRRSR